MYLRQVEMENFKSFGGKVVVPLMEGHTAITGPNGSGKSNITDAILFVIGPKSSKAVRAGKLTDLIFDGGRSKSKAGFTKVSLVFDNTDRLMPWDADEVRLTRFVKISENGEDYSSYFYINDQKSSMSEFDSLLTKARISGDGYNLVQQGDVTHIVQMGARERRGILDSISGIASFDEDIDKAKAERAETEGNLNNITIIVDELRVQVKQLEKDREAAQAYVEAKDTLDMAKAQYSHRKLQMETSALESQREQIVKFAGYIEQYSKEKAEFERLRSEKESEISDVEAEIAAKVGPEYKEVKDRIENAKVALAMAKDRIENAKDDIEQQNAFKEDFEQSIIENDQEIENLKQNRIDLDGRLKDLESQLEQKKAEEKEVSDRISNSGGELKKLQDRLVEVEAETERLGGQLREQQGALSKAEAEADEAHRNEAGLDEKLQNISFEIKDARWGLDQVKTEAGPSLEDYGAKILALKGKESELEREERELNEAFRRADAEYNELQAEKKVSDRMNQGSEAVETILSLRNRGAMKGIHGTIQELATVDKEYETALSVAAGGKMQAVIVDDDEVAAQAIAYLKKERKGRVTFLPLTKMMGGKPRAKAIMNEKNTEGYAINLIDFDQKYYDAFWYVLGDTLVVKDMESARRIMGGIRIVTMQGELIEASGAMVGGTLSQRNIMKFGAASEGKLMEASAKLKQIASSLDDVRFKLKEVRDQIHAADDEMRKSSSAGIEIREKVAQLKGRIAELEKTKATVSDQLKQARDATIKADKALEEAGRTFTNTSGELTAFTDERNAIKDRIAEIAPAELQERIQAVRDALYGLNNSIADIKLQIAGIDTEVNGYGKQNEALQLQLDAVAKTIAQDFEDIKVNEEAKDLADKDLAALRDIEAKMESGLQDLRNRKDELLNRKYEYDNKAKERAKDVENARVSLDSFRAQAAVLEQSVQNYQAEVQAIPFEVAQPIPSEEEIRRVIRSCEATIAKLGNVNLRAIDDYEEKKVRFDKLSDDVRALNEHIKELNDLMDMLGSKKKGLFMQSYNAVNENFKSIYAQLSGGGEAFMGLENEDDPFSGGLMINAKPRNGKLLRLEALSGGEKSLTALSFIFAIQEYQPSPFYVLDEVDMFLDSVNSEMVAKRIKESSRKAQFLQVSLRKVALSVADQLIGVTRPPTGISKVIIQPDLAEVSKYEEEAGKQNSEAI